MDYPKFLISDSECSVPDDSSPERGELYTDGLYNYVYGGYFTDNEEAIDVIGQYWWGAQLKDRKSTAPVTKAPLCEIKGFPVLNLSNTFSHSLAEYIDLSGGSSDFPVMNIVFTNNVCKIAINMDNMFCSCESKKIILPEGFGKNATSMNSMFNYARIKNIRFPEGFGEKVEGLGFMFAYTDMEKIEFPAGFGKNATDVTFMFYSAKTFAIDFPDGFGDNIKFSHTMFDNDSKHICFVSSKKYIKLWDKLSILDKPRNWKFVVKHKSLKTFMKNILK